MQELENLYSGLKPSCSNSLCEGCSILKESKPEHSYLDYEKLREGPVLFLSDSLKYKFGKLIPFSKKEMNLLLKHYPEDAQFAASVKCPSVKEGDMTPVNMKLCREHLDATIDKVKPKLVFTCGNLSMKMLIKKSGITSKRGSSFPYSTNSGHECTVVPIFHPYAVIKEPRHSYLFETDIKNAYDKYILGNTGSGDFSYEVLTTPEEVASLGEKLQQCKETLAVDLETTGLNFLRDKIMSISISSEEGTWVIPWDHKDSPFKEGEEDSKTMWKWVKIILENPYNKKVFHNAKFDLKFLLNHGINVECVWDTKILHHFINETAPKSLMDLVKLYFSNELENL